MVEGVELLPNDNLFWIRYIYAVAQFLSLGINWDEHDTDCWNSHQDLKQDDGFCNLAASHQANCH